MSKHKALGLADSLRTRTVRNWTHATGETPRASGYRNDHQCQQAAETIRAQHALIVQMREALAVGLEAAQELLSMKREALGDDYTKTRSYRETEREVCMALAAADQYWKDNP